MCAVWLTGAVANPQHVARACKPVARSGIKTGQRLFVFQQKAFVAGVEVHGMQRMFVFAVDPRRFHKIQRVRDAVRHSAVLPGLFRGSKAKRPRVNLMHIGIAAS